MVCTVIDYSSPINQSINQSARDPVIRVELKFRVCFHIDITVDFIFDCIDALPG